MPRFGVVGDVHGKIGWLQKAFEAFDAAGGVDGVLMVGDTGFDWPVEPGSDPRSKGDQASILVERYNAPILFVGGNHDVWPKFLSLPVEEKGLRVLRKNVFLLHGATVDFQGVKISGLGGASSSDLSRRWVYHRETGREIWWPQERVDRDLATKMIEENEAPVEILLTHEAPDFFYQEYLPPRSGDWSGYELRSKIDRLIIEDLHQRLSPRVHFFDHHHKRVSQQLPGHKTSIQAMGCDGQKYGLAAIYDSVYCSVENVVLEDF